jgi:hypothetical protein
MNSILTEKPKKNKFDLSREVKMTGNIGNLYPAFIQDVIPGDSFRVNTQQMIRFSPLLAPMMHTVNFKLDYFFVPYRLVWDEWKDFITGGEDGNDLPSYPRVSISSGWINNFGVKGTLADYLGIPVSASSNTGGGFNSIDSNNQQEISLLPFRAYQLIYHEYFRDQNVGTEYTQHTDSGLVNGYPSSIHDQCTLRKSNWEKDYFTSSLPFLQRGTEVELPLGKVIINQAEYDSPLLSTHSDMRDLRYNTDRDAANPTSATNHDIYGTNLGLDVEVNLTGYVESVSINELRKATALQRWLELMARAGSRYREQIFAIFGERIPDYTVQVPQYLGGGKTPIMISEVLSTYAQTSSASTGASQDRPQGDMSGHALGLGDNIGFTQSFDEHGIIIGVARVIPKASYVQGLSKFWQKFDKFDHYFPQFANLGEQEVYNKELYCKGDKTTDDQIFGYQQRYAEYKYAHNRVAGDFRDNLSYWEMSRRFTDHPVLNQSFIECDESEVSRVFAITDANEDKVWMNLYHSVDALRPIPYHSNPSLT